MVVQLGATEAIAQAALDKVHLRGAGRALPGYLFDASIFVLGEGALE